MFRLNFGYTNTKSLNGSGNNIPSWVETLRAPSGDLPLIASDWAGNSHWMGSGLVAVTDIWEENTDFNGANSWNPSVNITPSIGIVGSGIGPALKYSVYSQYFDQGFTGLTMGDWTNASTSETSDISLSIISLPSYDAEFAIHGFFDFGGTKEGRATASNYAAPTQSETVASGTLSASVNKIAGTITDTLIAVSANGSSPTSGSAIAPPSPFTSIGIYIAVNGNINPPACKLTALYSPQPSADLSSMST